MKRTTILCLSLTLLILFVGCKSAPVNLKSVEYKESGISLTDEASVAKNLHGNLVIAAAGGPIVDDEACVLFSLYNASREPYNFYDSSVSIYYGNIITGKWRLMSKWDAFLYLKSALRNYRSKSFWSGVGSAFDMVTIGLTRDNLHLGNSKVYSVDALSYGNYSSIIQTKMEEMESVIKRKDDKPFYTYIEDNLLYSARIPALGNYYGWLFFDAKKGADYRIDFTDSYTGEASSFYFIRSDR